MNVTQTFTPPSPGSWELEQTHLTKPPSVLLGELMPDSMMRGFKEGTRHYGLLLDHLEVAIINRFLYMAPRPVGAPKSAKGTPPRLVFEILRRVHPSHPPARQRGPARSCATAYWRADVEWWDNEVRPTLAARGARAAGRRSRVAVRRAARAHLRRAFEFLRTAAFYHHRFNFCSMVPLGDFLVHAIGWTGLSAGELLRTMKGLSPESAGAMEELAELRRAILADARGPRAR